MTKAFISGCSGPRLTAPEIEFFARERPWGLIVFRRNIEDPEQLAELVAAFRAAVGRPDAPVLIDQEGGRVQRLRPPHWPSYPPQKTFGDLFAVDPERGREAAWLTGRLIAYDLTQVGINVDCLPLLDLLFPETSEAIGDRAYGRDAEIVAALGRETAEGLLAGGVLPVIKHLPGHGRANVDSHLELPHVSADAESLKQSDFSAFRNLNDYPLGMTAHIVFEAIDPSAPATQSRIVVENIIRGQIGFGGCLMTDDICMHALGGDIRERTTACFVAGCDIVLHCNGDLEQMKAVAEVSPELSGLAGQRCDQAMVRLAGARAAMKPFDEAAARGRLRILIGD